jgi:hypothetical protein
MSLPQPLSAPVAVASVFSASHPPASAEPAHAAVAAAAGGDGKVVPAAAAAVAPIAADPDVQARCVAAVQAARRVDHTAFNTGSSCEYCERSHPVDVRRNGTRVGCFQHYWAVKHTPFLFQHPEDIEGFGVVRGPIVMQEILAAMTAPTGPLLDSIVVRFAYRGQINTVTQKLLPADLAFTARTNTWRCSWIRFDEETGHPRLDDVRCRHTRRCTRH